MTDIDWSKAPADATHFQPENELLRAAWLMKTDKSWYFRLYNFHQLHWNVFSGPETSLGDIVARPTAAPVWNGPEDGLPPVGLEVEARVAVGHYVGATKSDWAKCQVVALTRAYAILRCLGKEFSSDHEVSHELSLVEFRPIRTAEQLAAKERQRAIQEMNEVARSGDTPYNAKARMGGGCEALYDAGYRKVTK